MRGGGLEGVCVCFNRFDVAKTLSSAVVYTSHLFSPRDLFLTHQCNISENLKSTNTELKQQ